MRPKYYVTIHMLDGSDVTTQHVFIPSQKIREAVRLLKNGLVLGYSVGVLKNEVPYTTSN